ncbi:MAG: SDR family oxidoreductase [Bosea sp. (in: a-proteobacteria)]
MGGRAVNLFCFGLGYSAETLFRLHGDRFTSMSGTVRTLDKARRLVAAGVNAIVYAGGEPGATLLAALASADRLLVSAAPDERGDPMLRQLLPVLERAERLCTVIYLSTVGVYGDHGGGWVDETTPVNPGSERAKRRVEAEHAWTAFGQAQGVSVQIHRLAGIYGPGRSAIDDLREGTARRIIKEGQVFNRIHVEDIAGAVMAGFAHPEVSGVFNICDDEPAPPQDVVAFAAGAIGLPTPPETPFAKARLSEMGRSFYAESKRCRNGRLKTVLGYRLRYPTYREGLRALAMVD